MPPHDRNERIVQAADRIASYAASIQEAHALGHGPGDIDELWGREYQEKALYVYAATLPWPYLINLANGFRAIGEDMTVVGAPSGVAKEWLIVTDYLRVASDVILAFAPANGGDHDVRPLDPATPSVMEFGLLAEVASDAGASQLRAGGTAVSRAIGGGHEATEPNPLSKDQVVLLSMFGSGTTLVQIGLQLGYSSRTVQRKLDVIQHDLGAESRNEAIMIASAKGWIATEALDKPTDRPLTESAAHEA